MAEHEMNELCRVKFGEFDELRKEMSANTKAATEVNDRGIRAEWTTIAISSCWSFTPLKASGRPPTTGVGT